MAKSWEKCGKVGKWLKVGKSSEKWGKMEKVVKSWNK